MKYVRTKDEIYELQETKNGEKYLVRTNELIPLWNKNAYRIFMEANSIENLCDAFVNVGDDGECCFMSKLVYKAFKHKISKRNVYGAIWVFDGDDTPTLKPVAKMNEKGEWKLL